MGVIDQTILDLAKRDPRAAAGRLSEAFERDVHNFLANKLPPHAVEDVAGQVWLAVVEGIGRFAGQAPDGKPASVKTWLLSIAHHKATDFYRLRNRERLVGTVSKFLEGDENTPDALRDASSKGPARQIADEESRRRAAALIEDLDPNVRVLLEWRYGEGLMPQGWLDRIAREGCAEELEIAEEMAQYLAAEGEAKAALFERIKNTLTQRVLRASKKLVAARRALDKAPGKKRD